MRIIIFPNLSQEALSLAHSMLPEGSEMEVVAGDAPAEELIHKLSSADVMMGFVSKPLPPSVVESMGGLKLLQLLSAGYDSIDIEAMRRLRVAVATNGGANAVAVAEHTLMLMLAVYKDLANLHALVKAGGWLTAVKGTRKLYELAGKRVGLVGLGQIGREVAKRLRGFETSTIYHDLYRLSPDAEKELGVRFAELLELLQTADVVSLHLPLLPETHHLIDRAALASMKPSAILINTCRGAVVDTQALYEALKDGTIAGAGLDTLEEEPPPTGLPLLSLPNLTITPHTGGPTVDSWPKRLANGFANVRRVAEGQMPLWVIPELRDLLKE